MTRWGAGSFGWAAVAATFWGYYALPEQSMRAWAYYAAQGALLAACGALLRRCAVSTIGAWACVILVVEGAQQAVCGALHIGSPPIGDACVDLIGQQPYEAILSAAVSALIVRRIWSRRATS